MAMFEWTIPLKSTIYPLFKEFEPPENNHLIISLNIWDFVIFDITYNISYLIFLVLLSPAIGPERQLRHKNNFGTIDQFVKYISSQGNLGTNHLLLFDGHTFNNYWIKWQLCCVLLEKKCVLDAIFATLPPPVKKFLKKFFRSKNSSKSSSGQKVPRKVLMVKKFLTFFDRGVGFWGLSVTHCRLHSLSHPCTLLHFPLHFLSLL